MANILDRFQKTVVGSKGRFSDFTDVISPSGDFTRVSDLKVILESWYKILVTPTRTIDHDPEFGCDLIDYIFAPADEDTLQNIKYEIEYKITTYDNRANLAGVDIQYLNNKKGFVVNVVAEYEGESGEVKAVIDETNFNILE